MIQFPSGDAMVTGKKCKTCGFVMVVRKGEPEREECFCCAHAIPLPLSLSDECPECAGKGVVEVHVCVKKRDCAKKCPKAEPCAACGGTGRRG